jgi:hypothetical protein
MIATRRENPDFVFVGFWDGNARKCVWENSLPDGIQRAPRAGDSISINGALNSLDSFAIANQEASWQDKIVK